MTDTSLPTTQKGWFGLIAAWVIGLTVLGLVITTALWGLGVLFAPVAGKGGAFKQKESTPNRLFAQQNFEQLNADIGGYIAKIRVAKAAVASATDKTTRSLRQTELVGVTQTCIDTVQQYNADSRKYLLRDFKSAGLPQFRDASECVS